MGVPSTHAQWPGFPLRSLRQYSKGSPASWLVSDRGLDAFILGHDGRWRAAYVAWLEARAASDGDRIDEVSMEALRRGWYLGKESFRDRLLGLIDKVESGIRKKNSHAGGAVRAHNESEVERIVGWVGAGLGLPTERGKMALLKKGDRRRYHLEPIWTLANTSAEGRLHRCYNLQINSRTNSR